jgi:mono/diheme cytochrome c family protein
MKYFFLIVWVALSFLDLSGLARAPEHLQDPDQESIARGKEVYGNNCLGCHQVNGEGLPGVYPPLTHSDHLDKDLSKSIDILLNGQKEDITVNGNQYNIPMTSFGQLTDQQIADVLNYIGSSWGNKMGSVTAEQVKLKRN